MYKFSYKALSADGKKISGKIAATSEDDFNQVISSRGLKCYYVHATGKGDTSKLSKLDLALVLQFCRQLASMLNAGLPLIKSLEMLYERTDKPKLKNVLAALFEEVQKGNSLAEAMSQMGEVFPSLLVSMVKAGELSGKLEETLIRMADYYEKEKKRKGQIKSATSYPKIVLVICLAVVILLLVFVMPQMTSMISPDKMPSTTKFLLGIKDFIMKDYVIVIAVIASLKVFFPILKRIEKVDYFLSKMKLRIPIMAKVNKMTYTSRFSSSLCTLTSSGVHLLDALTMVSEMMDNRYVSNSIDTAIEGIRRGESISSALQSVDAFDPLLTTMIFVGEESGSLDEVLGQTARYFEDESEAALKGLTAMINPILMCVMAVVIGFVVIAMLQPMFSMYDTIGTDTE